MSDLNFNTNINDDIKSKTGKFADGYMQSMKYAVAKANFDWKHKKDSQVIGSCFVCNKCVVEGNIYAAISVKKHAIFSDHILEFDLLMHKACISDQLEACPFADPQQLKEIDLTTLDKV